MQAINTATYWHRRMNKIPVYLCIAILLGQVMLFSSEDSMNISSEDSEFDIENTVLTSGRNDAEDAGWVIETVETSSSQGSWVEHGKYNSLAIGSNGTPHISYLSAIETNYVTNHTSFDGQTWNSNTVATSNGAPCSALDSSDSPHVGIYTSYSSGDADLSLATNTGQNSSSWTLEMIDNSSSNVGSNCDMKVGPDGDIYVVYWKWEVNNHSLKFAHYDGNSWTTSDIDNDGGSDSSLQIDDLGNLHVSYRDLTNGGLKYGINNGQGWVLSTIEGNGQGRGNSLVLDSNNDPHVSYFDGYNNRLKYASLTGTSWSISTVEAGLSWGNSSNTDDTDTSIGIDSSGNVHISYYNAGLKYAFYDGTSWNFTLIDTVENIEGNTNLIVDDEQRIHISYHDKENKSLKYAFFEEETTAGGAESVSNNAYYNSTSDLLMGAWNASNLVGGTDYNVTQQVIYFGSILTSIYHTWTQSTSSTEYVYNPPSGNPQLTEGDTYCVRVTLYNDQPNGEQLAMDETCVTIPYTVSITSQMNYNTGTEQLWANFSAAGLTNGSQYNVYFILTNSANQSISSGNNQFTAVGLNWIGDFGQWPLNLSWMQEGATYCMRYEISHSGQSNYISYDESCVTIPSGSSNSGEINPYLNFDTTSLNLTADIDGSSLTIGDSYEVQYFLHRSLAGQDQLIDSGLETFSDVTARTFEIWDEWVLSSPENENGINRGDTYCLQVKLYNDGTHVTTENSCVTIPTTGSGEGGSGVTWSNMTIDSNGNVGMDSSLAIDSNGKVHISYRDSMADLKYATDKSGSWVTSTIDSDGIDSSLAIDSNGDVHISYYNVTSNALMYATDKDGSWVTRTIDSYWDVGMMSSLAIDSNDAVHISYYDDTHQDLKYATDKSGFWAITSTIDFDGTVGKYTSLAIDSNDDVHISYYDNTTDDLKYATDKSGSWATTMVDSLGNVGLYTSLAIDSNDNVHISYYHAGNGNLMYAFKNAAGWGSGAYDSDGNVGYDTSLAIDSNGDVHISYRDATTGDLKYAIVSSGSWVTSTIADDSSANMGVATSLAIDSNDDIHISYYHAGNGDLKYITTATSSGGEGGSGTDTDGSPEIFTSLLDTSPDNDLSAAFQVRNLSVSNSYSIEWALTTVDNNCGNDDGIIELPSDNFGNDLKASPYNITSSQIFNGNSEWIGLVMLNESMHPFDEYCLQVTLYENGMLVSNSTSFIQRTDHRDTDGDGVSNSEDDCPGTLSDVEVDVNGCFIDSSGDNSEEDLLPDDWYADIPVIGSLIEQAQTKYGKYAGVSVLSVTVLGYLYRGVTMRSEYKMNKRVKKFKKLINSADSAKELRRIQADLENADEKRLLPRGALGDLLSLIELRAEDLGLTDFITQDALIEAGITQEDLMAGVDALNQAREDLASAQFEADKKSRRGSAPSISQRDSPKTVATATLRGSAKGGGVKRPSYHPKDLNRDGSVDIDDERMWAEMSESEREEKRRESARTNTNIAGQVVAFSKLPPNLKSRCHCGKKKAYYKCHFKKDKCPCGSGKKFYQCCAKSRGY